MTTYTQGFHYQIGVSDEAARKAIERLVHAGILRQITVGKRNRAWAAMEVFDLLDEFDLMVRRPG